MTLKQLGVSRKHAADWVAIASLPKDVFEAQLNDPKRKPTTRALVNLAKGRPVGYRAGHALTEALRLALKLSREERISLCVAVLSRDDALAVAHRLAGNP